MKIEGRECNLQEELKKGNDLYHQMKKAVESNDLEPTAFVVSRYEWLCVKRVLMDSAAFFTAQHYRADPYREFVGTYRGVCIFVTKED